MIKIRLLKSILNLDGWNLPVNLEQWARMRLPAEDLEEFEALYAQVLELSSLHKVEPIYENIDGHIIQVGEYQEMSQEVYQYPIKQQWEQWYYRMKDDPAIVVWNYEELIS